MVLRSSISGIIDAHYMFNSIFQGFILGRTFHTFTQLVECSVQRAVVVVELPAVFDDEAIVFQKCLAFVC